MKKILFLLSFVFLFTQLIVAQPFNTKAAAKEYFASHILELDPIEGIYDVENVVVASAPGCGAERRVQNFTWAIWRNVVEGEEDEPMFIIESLSGPITGIMSVIERIGETTIYKLIRSDANKKIHEERFELDDLFSFGYTYRDAYGNATSTVTLRANKKYPTRSMYEAAISKVDEESNKNIEPQEWSGSGFALNNGYIATNYHVVENAKSITVQGIKGSFSTEYNATIVATDKYNDLALIKISDSRFSGFGAIPYRVKTSTSEVGKEVFVLGYPLTSTMGDEIKLTTGVVSSKTGFQGDVSLYQISAPIQPGNSGGPLFDKNGNLIGIVNAKHKGAENVGYAIKASYLNNLVESAVSSNILPSTNSVSGQPLTSKVKSLKNFVFMIKCSSSQTTMSSTSLETSYESGTRRTISYPRVNSNYAGLKIVSIEIGGNETILTLSNNNQSSEGYYQWMNIDDGAYIVANGQKCKLRKAEGIEISPAKTYFSYAGQTKTFKLYFPAIPLNTSSIDFIESQSSKWKIYGIQLR